MQALSEPPEAAPVRARWAGTGKYLTFHLASEEFGIEVLKVREIIGLQHITAVPHTPPYIRGVINLRGKVVPALDLRLKFGLPETEYGERTCIIVVQAQCAGGLTLMGLIVDAVSEVLNIAPADVEGTPDFGLGKQMNYILGIARAKGRVRILLDIDAVVAGGALPGLGTAAL